MSFDVREGEILGVIGPNGCGKTTLFNCILGQYRPDSGRVELHGRDVSRWRPHRRAKAGLARTFQLLQVFESMSVRDNLKTAAQEHIGSMGRRLFRRPTWASTTRSTGSSSGSASPTSPTSGPAT